MFVIKQMRINKFERKPIVSNRELFIAKGKSLATIESKEKSDCYEAPTIVGASKTKVLGLAKEIGETAIAKHITAGEASSLPNTSAKDK